MEIEIVEKHENPLLNRLEVKGKIHHDGEPIPSRESVKAKVAALLNKPEELVIIKRIDGQFGVHESVLLVNVYETKEKAMEMEPAYILKRNGLISEE